MTASNSMLHRPPSQRIMISDFHLIWLDENINDNDDDCRSSITKLKQAVNTVNTFVDIDQCIDFITDQSETTAFMVVSEELGQLLISVVQNIPQIKSIYILCPTNISSENWTNKCPKVSGIFRDVTSICEAFLQVSNDYDHDAVSISIAKASNKISADKKDTIDCSFMYTQILKDILLTISFDDGHKKDFYTYCRTELTGNSRELENIDKIEKEYRHPQPMWWYTRQSFLYSMVNRALHLKDVGAITKMGFFVCDLHTNIAALHSQQFNKLTATDSFVVYRGQPLSQTDFDQLQENEGGLLAFNNFLSTSKSRDVSLRFIQRNAHKTDLVNVFFVMQIDPSIKDTPFADLSIVSAIRGEEEILFSMHSVFRIGRIKKLVNLVAFWEVELKLTNENDPELYELTGKIKEDIRGSTGWNRLGNLFIRLAQYDQAEQLCQIWLKQIRGENEKLFLFYLLAEVHKNQGKYTEAIEYYEQSLEILKKTFPVNLPDLATSYNNIGLVYYDLGNYSKAFEYHEKSLEIQKKTLPTTHPSLATSYNNIGSVYNKMGEYCKAIEYHRKSLAIEEKALPANHPHLAASYNGIASVYKNIGENSKAIEYCEKSLEIWKKTLPAHHPHVAASYNNIGFSHCNMGKYSKAIECFEKSLEIRKRNLPATHPDLAISYNNIGSVYNKMGEYSKAIEYYEQSLEILKKTFPVNHPDLATSYNNIGSVYCSMKKYSKAIEYHEKSLEIRKKTLPINHPDLAASYSNSAFVYETMRNYRTAYEYFERSLSIWTYSLPANHPHIKMAKGSTERVKKKL